MHKVMGISKKTPLVETKDEILSPWVTLQHRSIEAPSGRVEVYHSLKQADYTSIVALTKERQVILVRQYRSAVDAYTVETPGGITENNEDIAEGILRELSEETGYVGSATPVLLGKTRPDIGRLGNWLYGYFIEGVELAEGWESEPGVECFLASADELCDMIASGEMNSALHIWLVTQAALQGYWPEFLETLINGHSEKRI